MSVKLLAWSICERVFEHVYAQARHCGVLLYKIAKERDILITVSVNYIFW